MIGQDADRIGEWRRERQMLQGVRTILREQRAAVEMSKTAALNFGSDEVARRLLLCDWARKPS
jgi:hypothetical protein